MTSNSKFLKCIICCLRFGLHTNVIRRNTLEEFTVKLLHNKNPKWDRSYIKLFECIEICFGREKYERYICKKAYYNECKQRFKANMRKLVKSKFLEFLGEDKLNDSCKERRYRILPEKSVLDLFANSEKMDEVSLYMRNGYEGNIHKGLQVSWSPSYQEDESYTVGSPGRAISTNVSEVHSLTWSPPFYQGDESFSFGSPGSAISNNFPKVKTVSITSNTPATQLNILQNHSAQVSNGFLETRFLNHEMVSSPGHVVPGEAIPWMNGIVPSPDTVFESNDKLHNPVENLTYLQSIPPEEYAPSDGMSSLLPENETSYDMNSFMETFDTAQILNGCDPMFSSTAD